MVNFFCVCGRIEENHAFTLFTDDGKEYPLASCFRPLEGYFLISKYYDLWNIDKFISKDQSIVML